MKLLVVGTGYVGLVTGTCFAEMGHHVTCLDTDKERIHRLQEGIIPIYEPGLKELVQRNMKAGRLDFTSGYTTAVQENPIIFIAVGTPQTDDGACDLSQVYSAASCIAAHMDGYRLIVDKSTVPVGTAQAVTTHIQKALDKRGALYSFDVVSNPEFLKEGCAVADFMKPDRILIGADKPAAADALRKLYSAFTVNHDRILIMDTRSAEMTKYAANAMLATRISFMNELARLCECTGADINNIRLGMGSDKRIGSSFLYAGAGYGGSCFPKDIQALMATAKQQRSPMELLAAVHSVNERQKQRLGEKLIEYFQDKGGLQGKTIALWGLAFKPDTDDVREAPALTLIKQLLSEGAQIQAYDPVAMKNAAAKVGPTPHIRWCPDEVSAAKKAHALVLVTEWKQFRFIDFKQIRRVMRGTAFFDGRNQYRLEDMKEHGFDYFSIGRKPIVHDHVESFT